MKSVFRSFLMVCFLLSCFAVQAQVLTSASSAAAVPSDVAMAKATVSQEAVEISLDAEQPFTSSYTLNLSDWGFKNNEIARKYFNSISDNLVHYVPDFNTGKVTVNLQVANLGDRDWSVEDWNTYLGERSARYTKYFASMNQ